MSASFRLEFYSFYYSMYRAKILKLNTPKPAWDANFVCSNEMYPINLHILIKLYSM